MGQGKFIVFEGIDGSGTTTQARAAANWLRSQDVDVVETHEPTDGPVGELLRKALSRQMPGCEGEMLEPHFFALLFATDRMHHMRTLVVPAIEAGQYVVSDRCYLSSFAYQSVDYDLDLVRAMNGEVRRADLTFLLDLDVEEADRRLTPRTLFDDAPREVFETPEMMARVRANYLDIADLLEAEGERIVRIDAGQSREAVAAEVRQTLAELL
ncbi:MAG: dTMP kinase [Planctomycetota bacterium]